MKLVSALFVMVVGICLMISPLGAPRQGPFKLPKPLTESALTESDYADVV